MYELTSFLGPHQVHLRVDVALAVSVQVRASVGILRRDEAARLADGRQLLRRHPVLEHLRLRQLRREDQGVETRLVDDDLFLGSTKRALFACCHPESGCQPLSLMKVVDAL